MQPFMQQPPQGIPQAYTRVVKLMLQETGTYNPQYMRPYEASMTDADLNTMKEQIYNAPRVQAAMVADFAGQFLRPSAAPERAVIVPNGWDTPRMRFLMEVEHRTNMGTVITEMITGYTDYYGASRQSDALDPQMTFFINSMNQVRRTVEYNHMGSSQTVNVIESSHVLGDDNWTGVTNPVKQELLRPTDVYAIMSRSKIPQREDMYDTRNVVTSGATKSRRSNSLPTEYVANVMRSFQHASMEERNASNGEQDQSIFGTARGFIREEPVNRDPFMKAIANIQGRMPSKMFTWGDLKRLDPNVEHVTGLYKVGHTQRADFHVAGTTSDWADADLWVLTATKLSQAVPSVLMDLGLVKMAFVVSNRNFGVDTNNQIRFSYGNVESFSTQDLTPLVAHFERKMLTEVLPLISDEQIGLSYMVDMQVDLAGETVLNLSIGNTSVVKRYVTPSFCDSLLVPVVTYTPQVASFLAQGFEELLSNFDFAGAPSGLVGNTANQPVWKPGRW